MADYLSNVGMDTPTSISTTADCADPTILDQLQTFLPSDVAGSDPTPHAPPTTPLGTALTVQASIILSDNTG